MACLYSPSGCGQQYCKPRPKKVSEAHPAGSCPVPVPVPVSMSLGEDPPDMSVDLMQLRHHRTGQSGLGMPHGRMDATNAE